MRRRAAQSAVLGKACSSAPVRRTGTSPHHGDQYPAPALAKLLLGKSVQHAKHSLLQSSMKFERQLESGRTWLPLAARHARAGRSTQGARAPYAAHPPAVSPAGSLATPPRHRRLQLHRLLEVSLPGWRRLRPGRAQDCSKSIRGGRCRSHAMKKAEEASCQHFSLKDRALPTRRSRPSCWSLLCCPSLRCSRCSAAASPSELTPSELTPPVCRPLKARPRLQRSTSCLKPRRNAPEGAEARIAELATTAGAACRRLLRAVGDRCRIDVACTQCFFALTNACTSKHMHFDLKDGEPCVLHHHSCNPRPLVLLC